MKIEAFRVELIFTKEICVVATSTKKATRKLLMKKKTSKKICRLTNAICVSMQRRIVTLTTNKK